MCALTCAFVFLSLSFFRTLAESQCQNAFYCVLFAVQTVYTQTHSQANDGNAESQRISVSSYWHAHAHTHVHRCARHARTYALTHANATNVLSQSLTRTPHPHVPVICYLSSLTCVLWPLAHTLFFSLHFFSFVRGLGFLYLRYSSPPKELWEWYVDYLDDPSPIALRGNKAQPTYVQCAGVCVCLVLLGSVVCACVHCRVICVTEMLFSSL